MGWEGSGAPARLMRHWHASSCCQLCRRHNCYWACACHMCRWGLARLHPHQTCSQIADILALSLPSYRCTQGGSLYKICRR